MQLWMTVMNYCEWPSWMIVDDCDEWVWMAKLNDCWWLCWMIVNGQVEWLCMTMLNDCGVQVEWV